MVQDVNLFKFNLIEEKDPLFIAQITVPNSHISAVYKEALLAQKDEAEIYGFPKGMISLNYIENNYKTSILSNLKELFFNHCITNFLCKSIQKNKIVIAGDPKLKKINLDPQEDANFLFSFWKVSNTESEKWKKIKFKAPQRKKYKDLDRQVESFIDEELGNEKSYSDKSISVHDWVCFDLQILNNKNEPLLPKYKDKLWIKIGAEDADREFREFFLEKKIGDELITKDNSFQEYISNKPGIKYPLLININQIVPEKYFSLNLFKKYFQIKNINQIHTKLIEVFSFRNDISQRRETIELALRSLLKQYYITLPPHLLELQKQLVLSDVHENPDYLVYKAQSNFKEQIELLAEKQLKETIIIDSIAYQENIKVLNSDVIGYLNLMNRQRTRDFLYFKIPSTKYNGQEIPISNEILKQYCLREKTLNYIINYLTTKSY